VWDWNATTGVYELSNFTKPAKVADGTRITTKNVLLLDVQQIDDAGVPRMVTEGASGKGVLASGGKSIPVTWSKADNSSRMIVKDSSGKEVQLEPGNTWVHTIPTNVGASWDISAS
jgi:hypothetical protein